MPRKGAFLNNVVQHIKFNADNTYDIGAAGANRPRDVYVADDVVAGGDVSGATANITGVTTTGGVNSSGDITLTDPGTNANSKEVLLVADNGGTPQTSALQTIYGADPYLRISPPNDAGTKTATVDIHDTSIVMCTDNTVDIGAAGANRPKNLFLSGDITAAGGFAQTLAHWFQDNVAAEQTAVALLLNGSATRSELPMVRAGSVLGLVVYSNEARSAGTLTCQVTVDGTAITGHDAVIDDDPTQTVTVAITQGEHTFTAGQRVGVKITTDASWAPTTADITVCVLVEC